MWWISFLSQFADIKSKTQSTILHYLTKLKQGKGIVLCYIEYLDTIGNKNIYDSVLMKPTIQNYH